MPRWLRDIPPEIYVLLALALFTLQPFGQVFGRQMTDLFIFAILALGLNVVVGYTGLLHLGIAAFFGIGAYLAAIVTVPGYPFQWGFIAAVVIATVGAALAGIVVGAPALRLRGDYLAVVTLGFGEVTRYAIRNLEEITAGTRNLNPVPPPTTDAVLGVTIPWADDYRPYYLLCLALLIAVVAGLRALEQSRLGRAWIAVREDDLAASCMGINTARVKLSAFAIGAALAGLAGCLYATKLGNTAGPDAFDFARSIMMLCCLILGGLGSVRGALLGVFLIVGFDTILAPWVDGAIQEWNLNPNNYMLLKFSSWRLMIFGLALIFMMRFRPIGLLPSERISLEYSTQLETAAAEGRSERTSSTRR